MSLTAQSHQWPDNSAKSLAHSSTDRQHRHITCIEGQTILLLECYYLVLQLLPQQLLLSSTLLLTTTKYYYYYSSSKTFTGSYPYPTTLFFAPPSPSLPPSVTNFKEASYDGNDDNSCIIVEDGTEADDGERVIKLCFSSLIKFHCQNATIKAHFIKIVQSFVINNTEIAVRASMILHYIVMECIRTHSELPADFCSRGFIGQVVNFTKQPPLLSNEAIAALGDPFEPPFNLTGRAWLFGYLETTIHSNIESSTMKKWTAVINDSIDTHATIHLCRASRQATDHIKKEIR